MRCDVNVSRELDAIIAAIESGIHGRFVLRLLRWRKAWLERLIP